MSSLFHPSSLAIIGISRSTPSLGRMILDNLIDSGYKGSVFLVNPNANEIASHPVYNDIVSLPDSLDQAVILAPPRFVPQTMRELADKGCEYVTIISAGFSEKLNDEMLHICQNTGMRMVGPNSMGTYAHHTNISFSPIAINPGTLGYISQSGSIVAVVQELMVGGFGFSKFISLGNKVDITESDIISYLVADENTSVIGGYLESFSDPTLLRRQLIDATREKPVILVKGGRTEEGSKAVTSHTGALAGNFRLTQSLMRESGVLLVPTIEKQIALARFIDKFGITHHHGVVTISSAGGPGVLAADEIVEYGLNLAQLLPETMTQLKEVIPPFGNPDNPLDLVADAGIYRYIDTINIIRHDPNVSTIVVIIVHPVLIETEPLLEELNKLDLPIICAYLGPEYSSFDHYDNLIIYQTTEEIAWILKQVNQYHFWRDSVDHRTRRAHLDDTQAHMAIEPTTTVHDLLQSYGFTYPSQMKALEYTRALTWFKELNQSVAMKLDHPQFSHKTDSGGVILDISSDEEFSFAWEQLQQIYNENDIPADERKVEIQEFYADGIEIVLGIIKDEQFGHFLLVGAGGTLVEMLDDTVFLPSPTSRFAVKQALQSLKIFQLLQGYRGSSEVDLDQLVDQVLELDLVINDHPDIIELDINPLYIVPETDEFVVLDARMKKS